MKTKLIVEDLTAVKAHIIAASGIPADKIEVIGVRMGPPDLTALSIREIALLIRKDWKRVWFGAVPYLDAMATIDSISDHVMHDSCRDIVNYFLGNATQWRGETAKAVKTELKRRLGR